MKDWWAREAQRLRAVPLVEVLRAYGAEPDPADPHKWHTPRGTLSVCEPKFMNWREGRGGGGAIDLVIHLTGLRFREALAWLARLPAATVGSPPPAPPARSGLQLPRPDPTRLGRITAYLTGQRGLAPALIDALIQAGALYADARANAVFLLWDQHHAPIGAELRGTLPDRPWRGLASGTRKDLGFFSVPATPMPAVIICESAIDAISCSLLHPGCRCISTAGARPNPLWLAAIVANAVTVYCGFDADPTGDDMATAMIAMHPTIHRRRPSRHDWNDVLRGQR